MTAALNPPIYPSIEDVIGRTPLVRLQRLPGEAGGPRGNLILGKLEGNNPAGSVKDRPAMSMIRRAEERGEIRPGDTLIEATSGNTGIALAMAAAIRGYRMVLIMPEDLSIERAQTMRAFGAELILTPRTGGRDAGKQTLFAGEPARHVFGVRLRHVDRLVDPLRVVDLGQIGLGPLADARDARTLGRLRANDAHGRILPLQKVRHAGDGAGGAHRADKMGDAPGGLLPDLGPGGLEVHARVVGIGKLVEHTTFAVLLHLFGQIARVLHAA